MLAALKKCSKRKEMETEKEIVEVLKYASDRIKNARKVKNRDDKILDCDFVFVG